MDYTCYLPPSQAKEQKPTTIRASLLHTAMICTPPRYPVGHRVNINTCALCGRRRSSRYRSSLDPEPLVCSRCVKASASPNVVIEFLVRGYGHSQVKPDASQVVDVSPTGTPPRPVELPAGERSSRHRNHRRLSPIDEEAPAVDRSTKPKSYQRP